MKNIYNVLIVERKKQMVHVYENMLNWEEFGFQVSSVTDNEDQALSYYGEYKHDLVFTEIDLLLGNGISLIKQIRFLDPTCQIIVISSQDNYDSLRGAFLAGCNDYLLKSRIRYSSLASILEEAREKLDNNKELSQYKSSSFQLENLLGLLRDKQKIDSSLILSTLENEHIHALINEYQVIYFRMDNVRIFNRTKKQFEKPLWMSTAEFINMFQNKLLLRDEMQVKLKQIIQDCLIDHPLSHLLFTKKHSGLIILPMMKEEKIKKLAQKLIMRIKAVLTYDFSITVSSVACGVESFITTYEEVLDYHQNKFYDGDFCVEAVSEKKIFHELLPYELNYSEKIVNCLDTQCYDDVFTICSTSIDYMVNQRIEPRQVKRYFVSLIDKAEDMLHKKGIKEVFCLKTLRQGLDECETITSLNIELLSIMNVITDWMKSNHASRYKSQVSQMNKYILEHINQKVTLSMISDVIGITEIQAGRIFKKETGKSVIEYINEVKMEKASELLKNNSLKIKDVAMQVGIKDQLYFNKVFKKQFKLSPREYRKKL